MIVAFDLDDTLYRELDFVESGFRAVAAHVAEAYGVDVETALGTMYASLEKHGRGRQFDDLLLSIGKFSQGMRNRLVHVYRHHEPNVTLPAESDDALRILQADGHRLFMVTDGHKVVQANKVSALGLWSRFEHVYLTGRYGHQFAKPSPKVFELLLRRTGSEANRLVYVGDDPRKDFIGVRSIGGQTIQILTGPCARLTVRPGYEADMSAHSIAAVTAIILGAIETRTTA